MAYGSSATVALRYCRRCDIVVPDVELAGPGVGGPTRGAQSGTGVAESTGIVQSYAVIECMVKLNVSLRSLTDIELDDLARSVAAEISRRAAASSAATAATANIVYTTPHGHVWHLYRECRHLRRAVRVIEHEEPPTSMRCCRDCERYQVKTRKGSHPASGSRPTRE